MTDPKCTKCNSPFEPHHHRHSTREGIYHTSCYFAETQKPPQSEGSGKLTAEADKNSIPVWERRFTDIFGTHGWMLKEQVLDRLKNFIVGVERVAEERGRNDWSQCNPCFDVPHGDKHCDKCKCCKYAKEGRAEAEKENAALFADQKPRWLQEGRDSLRKELVAAVGKLPTFEVSDDVKTKEGEWYVFYEKKVVLFTDIITLLKKEDTPQPPSKAEINKHPKCF